MLNWAGSDLRALGRLREAVEPTKVCLEMFVKEEDWILAAGQASNLSELRLTLGDLALAFKSAEQSVMYADKSGDMFRRIVSLTAHADVLHQAGQTYEALHQFQVAEALQQKDPPYYPYLYSFRGFQYCDLLLSLEDDDDTRIAAVLERVEETLGWARQNNTDILSAALDQLTLGRARLRQGDLPQAATWLQQAVVGLRAGGGQHNLPWGLLARAALFRHTGDFLRAHQDLQEVFEIAEPSGMRLHLSDYHLEMARLLLAEEKLVEAREHVEKAAGLIEATGYHRRDAELTALQKQVS